MISATRRKPLRHAAAVPLWLACVGACAPVVAAEQPLWEAAFGLVPSTFPAYRGSADQVNYLLPFPYLIYRGEVFRSDKEGIRARLFDSERVEVNLSANAAIPVFSDDSEARRGMAELDPTIELGPAVNLLLARSARGTTLKLGLPVRAAIATDLSRAEHVGWVFQPQLRLDSPNHWGGMSASLGLGPMFATSDYHRYYYEVDAIDATATRPAYRASGGYSGTVLLATLSRRMDKAWIGGFLRYDNLAGTAFEDSPLVETEHSVMAGVAVAWFFARSSQMVDD